MIEKTVLNYLIGKFPNMSVTMTVPSKPPNEYIVIEKTGSGRVNHINTATIAIQSYAKTLLRALELNEEVKAAMDDIIILDEIANSELNSDYNFTDVRTKTPRYQAVYDLVHY